MNGTEKEHFWYYTSPFAKSASVQVKDETTKGLIAQLVIFVE